MNKSKDLLAALRDRLKDSDGRVSAGDVDLLIWASTSLNHGEIIQLGEVVSYRDITLTRKLHIPVLKIHAIKYLRQMSVAVTGNCWGLRESKDLIDSIELGGTAIIFRGIELTKAIQAIQAYNGGERDCGYVASIR